MPPKVKEIFLPVKDEAHWKDVTGPDNKKITVIDLYFPWFGRCEAIDEALRALYMSLEEPEKKLQFLYADITNIQIIKKPSKSTAKPKFLIYLVWQESFN